jgi:hypothetical protein
MLNRRSFKSWCNRLFDDHDKLTKVVDLGSDVTILNHGTFNLNPCAFIFIPGKQGKIGFQLILRNHEGDGYHFIG